jgi:hypothetical protein
MRSRRGGSGERVNAGLSRAGLRAVAQVMVGEHDGEHGLADGHGADADTRIVAALGGNLGLGAILVHRLARREDR